MWNTNLFSRHPLQVWISFANSEMAAIDHPDDATRIAHARAIFEKGHNALKSKDAREERVILLEAWREFERNIMSSGKVDNDTELVKIEERMPKVVKKRRRVTLEDGSSGGWEEHYDFIFPEDDKDKPSFKLLSMAQKWKLQQMLGSEDDDDEEEEEEDDDDDAEEDDDKEANGTGDDTGSRSGDDI